MEQNNQLNYANIGDRVLAFITDIVIKWALAFIILLTVLLSAKYFGSSEQHIYYNDIIGSFPFNAIFVILVFIESVYFAAKGTTIGNKIFKLKILTQKGANPGLFRCFFRSLFEIFISYPILIGVAPIIYSPQKKAWHDSVFGTYVVSEKPVPEQIKEVSVSVNAPFIIGFAAIFSAVSYYLITIPSSTAVYYYMHPIDTRMVIGLKLMYAVFKPVMLMQISENFTLYWIIISAALLLLAAAAMLGSKRSALKTASTYILFTCITCLLFYLVFDYVNQAGLLPSYLRIKLRGTYAFTQDISAADEKKYKDLFGDWDEFAKNFDAKKLDADFINKWKELADPKFTVNIKDAGAPKELRAYCEKLQSFFKPEIRKQYLNKGECYLLFDNKKRLQAFAVLKFDGNNINVAYFELAPWNLCGLKETYNTPYLALCHELFKNIALLYKKQLAAKSLIVEILPYSQYPQYNILQFYSNRPNSEKIMAFDRRSIIIFLYPEAVR